MKKLKSLFLIALFCIPTLAISNNKPPKNKAIVYVYRPSKTIGFGWIFKLKANDKEVAKIKNGKKVTLMLNPGSTHFELRKNSFNMDLKEGKTYYLRASLVRNLFLGKPELVEVTESFAKGELDSDKSQ